MANGTNISDGLKWFIGIFMTLALGAVSYSVNMNMSNEQRITTLEVEVRQVRSELNDIWAKYNVAMAEKEGSSIDFAITKAKIDAIEKEIEKLKK